MSARYSDEAQAKRHAKNAQNFIAKATKKFGKRYDYSRVDYVTQKTPVTIGCPEHRWVVMTPDKHLQSKTGCRECGNVEKASSKSINAGKKFVSEFESRFMGKLELLSPYKGSHELISVRCLEKGHEFQSTPTNLSFSFKNGCPKCNREAIGKSQRLTQEEFIGRVSERFPDMDFSATKYTRMADEVSFRCPKHGLVKRIAYSLFDTNYGCPRCGDAQIGYAGYRLQKLEEGDVDVVPRPTRIALMEMEIWGIKTYKLGVTTRSLEQRYAESLKKVYFEAVLDEIDALRLERLLHVKYSRYRDERVFKSGLRRGERWKGDSELYFKKAVKPILDELRTHVTELEKHDPHYWDRYPDLDPPKLEIRRTSRRTNSPPKPVICLDDGRTFETTAAAARATGTRQGNVWAVCQGKRGTVNGLRFAYLEDYERGTTSNFVPFATGKKPVICLDTGEVFADAREAGAAKGCHSSNIAAVCKGRHRTSGGFRWAYLKDYEEGNLPIPKQRHWQKPVIEIETGRVFRSGVEASKALGISKGEISRHCRGHVKSRKFRFVENTD